jgi:hypothetical protein
LEKLAPQQDKEQGKDVADYLIKQDWRLFRKQDIRETKRIEPQPVESLSREKSEKSEASKKNIISQFEHLHKDENLKKPEIEILTNNNIQDFTKLNNEQPLNWDNDIADLENYFAGIKLPTQPVKLNKSSTIKDCSLFIESHFATVKANNGKRTFFPYLKRLQELKQVLTTNSN